MAKQSALKVPTGLSPEKQAKVDAILKKYEEQNRQIEREHAKEMAKLYGGAALQIGSAFIPGTLGLKAAGGAIKALTPYVGRKLAQNVATSVTSGLASGAVEGLGRGLIEKQNPLKTMATDSLAGGLLGGLGSYGLGNLAQRKALYNIHKNPTNERQVYKYFDDYIKGLDGDPEITPSEKYTVKDVTPFQKEFRYLRKARGGKQLFAEQLNDLIADENGNPINVFHGTGTYFDNFDKNMLGSLTGANSAKKGFWFSEGENTAKSYAKYAAENSELNKLIKKQQAMERMPLVNWNEYDKLTEQIEQMALNGEPSTPRLIRANLDMNNPAYYDAKGQKFMEIQQEINDFLENNPQADGFVIRNLRDAVDNSYDEATNHYMIRNPEQIKILENRLLEDL